MGTGDRATLASGPTGGGEKENRKIEPNNGQVRRLPFGGKDRMLRVNETSSPPGGNRATPLGQTNASDSAGGNRATPLGQTTAPDSAGVHIFYCQSVRMKLNNRNF